MKTFPYKFDKKSGAWRVRGDYKDLLLNLELIKENFEYRRLWNQHRIYTALAIQKNDPFTIKNGKRKWKERFLEEGAFIDSLVIEFKNLGLNIETFLFFYRKTDFENLDPRNPLDLDNLPKLSKWFTNTALPEMFCRPGLVHYRLEKTRVQEWRVEKLLNPSSLQLKPCERLLSVDLSIDRAQLEQEFKTFLDKIEANRRALWFCETGYGKWKQDIRRVRKERLQHLKVWRARRQKKRFATISVQLKLSEQATKDSFYRACELIQGRRYDLETDRERMKKYKGEFKICRDCSKRDPCNDTDKKTCPDFLEYLNQDQVEGGRELPLKTTTLFDKSPDKNFRDYEDQLINYLEGDNTD